MLSLKQSDLLNYKALEFSERKNALKNEGGNVGRDR